MNAPTSAQAMEHATALTTTGTPATGWKDQKRYLWALSPAIPVLGITALGAYQLAPKKLRPLSWIGPLLIHAAIPAADPIMKMLPPVPAQYAKKCQKR